MWIIIAVILVAIVVVVVVAYPMISMKPTPTGQVADTDIIAARNGRNAVYFLKTSDGYIMIDAGADLNGLEATLRQLSIDPLDVRHILLTHADSDHTAGLSLFPNAKIYINEDEMQMLDGSTKRNLFGYSTLPDGFGTERFTTLADEQQLIVDCVSIHSIKAPGHTPGSMVFLIDQKYLFTGDAVRVNNSSLLVHPFTMDTTTSKETLVRISQYISGCQYVLTAHYGYFATDNLQVE